MKKLKKLVVWNTNFSDDKPIIICTKWKDDKFGGLAVRETTFMIKPGEAIDLAMIRLSLKKPIKKIMEGEM